MHGFQTINHCQCQISMRCWISRQNSIFNKVSRCRSRNISRTSTSTTWNVKWRNNCLLGWYPNILKISRRKLCMYRSSFGKNKTSETKNKLRKLSHFQEIKSLRYISNNKGIETNPSKIEAIRTFDRSKWIKNLWSFLGLFNYCRRFIKKYSRKARALEKLWGSKEVKWEREIALDSMLC